MGHSYFAGLGQRVTVAVGTELEKNVAASSIATSAKVYIYRKTGFKRWEEVMSSPPEAKGTTVSPFAAHAGEPGVVYAANNRGLFRSDDAGRSWKALDLPWPEPGLADGAEALACLPE